MSQLSLVSAAVLGAAAGVGPGRSESRGASGSEEGRMGCSTSDPLGKVG